jgi:hypothetical protein
VPVSEAVNGVRDAGAPQRQARKRAIALRDKRER